VIDYRVRAPQFERPRDLLLRPATCGILGSATFSAAYTTSADVFPLCGAGSPTPSARRSALQIDGVNSYTTMGRCDALLRAAPRSAGLQPPHRSP